MIQKNETRERDKFMMDGLLCLIFVNLISHVCSWADLLRIHHLILLLLLLPLLILFIYSLAFGFRGCVCNEPCSNLPAAFQRFRFIQYLKSNGIYRSTGLQPWLEPPPKSLKGLERPACFCLFTDIDTHEVAILLSIIITFHILWVTGVMSLYNLYIFSPA